MAKAKSSNQAKKTSSKKPMPADLAPEEVSAEAGEFEASGDADGAEADAEMDREIESEMDEQLEMELEANSDDEESDEVDAVSAKSAKATKSAKESKTAKDSGRKKSAKAKAAAQDDENVNADQESGSNEDDGYEPEPFPNYKGADDASERKKVQIEFPYSQVIRGKVPKVFEVAETVAEEWVNDGNFENVPVGHPLAQITVAAGLRKAKEVEKKLEEKGVFAMAKMGLEYAKSQLNDKFKKK